MPPWSETRIGLRSRVGLRPTSPQHAAGMRIEPRPSDACAIGTFPAATDDAPPPLEPPRMCVGFHDLRHGPRYAVSLVPVLPYSGVLVLPSRTIPLLR